jgi:hypothetical protein
VVLVQSHLLRDKQSVRLRRIQCDSTNLSVSSSVTYEKFVSLQNLADTILTAAMDEEYPLDAQKVDSFSSGVVSNSIRSYNRVSKVDCVYVEADQFWVSDKQLTKYDTQNWKAILKTFKSISQKSETFLESLIDSTLPQGTVVIATDLPFLILREYGTCLMSRGESTAAYASEEVSNRHPKHKRTLRTLATAIDATMKKYGYWTGAYSSNPRVNNSRSRDLILFLHSRLDDRFDMITMGEGVVAIPSQRESSSRKLDRKKS